MLGGGIATLSARIRARIYKDPGDVTAPVAMCLLCAGLIVRGLFLFLRAIRDYSPP